ncbi:MAG: hypothetical protein HPY74_08375 [Firmicutes bacterium]|nr:hypothetical protein [Bacillota bacterium]
MSKAVVFARPIRQEWLDKTVEMLLNSQNRDEIKKSLNVYLANYIKSSTNIRKTREILMNIWVDIDDNNRAFRDKSLEVYKNSIQSDRLAIHWAMLLLAFPIFRDLCTIIGKLTDMQEEITLSQIKRRIFEIWGERSTLIYSVPKNIKTLRDCGVLEQVKTGVYKVVKHEIKNNDVSCLLLYAVFKTSDKLYHSFSHIDKLKELFPFIIEIGIDDLSLRQMFRLERMGGETVVSIK